MFRDDEASELILSLRAFSMSRNEDRVEKNWWRGAEPRFLGVDAASPDEAKSWLNCEDGDQPVRFQRTAWRN
jgi:hypothetical protein